MVQYLFNTENDAIDCLINHVYQKSVSEVLIKIMNIEENNFNEDLSEAIHKRKVTVFTKLVNKLDLDNEEQDFYNVAAVLNELVQINDFFAIVARKPTIQRLSDMAFNNEQGLSESRTASKSVLEKLVQKINDKKGQRHINHDDDDDDMIIKQESDEDETHSQVDNSTIEAISCIIPKI